MAASLDLEVYTSSSALALSWNDVAATTFYAVHCNNVVSSEEPNGAEIEVYSNSHSISATVYNSTRAMFNNLLPGASYNCCVAAFNFSDHHDCVTSVVQTGGLTTPVVGLIGGILGALIALLAVFTIGGIIVASISCKKNR